MAADYRGRPQLSAQPKTKPQTAPSESFACPYCEYRIFSSDENLWSHVQTDHTNELDELDLQFQGGEGFYRKLLRKNALLKGKTLEDATARKDGQKEELTQGPEGAPGLGRLSIDHQKRKATRQPARHEPLRKGTKGSGALSPIKTGGAEPDLAYDITSKHVPNILGPPLAAQQSFHAMQDFQSPGPPLLPPHDQPVQLQPQLGAPFQKAHRSHGHPHHEMGSGSSPAPSRLPSHPSGTHSEPASNSEWPDLILQPDSRPISQEQLAAEVKSIYAGLVMVENKCISVDRTQATASHDDPSQPAKLASDHWQALIALHRTLLHEHHDFFLASQHPSASPALKRLALKYSMPARMWKHGIHSFLELLRRRLPESLDYMLAFIYLAYQMMALLYETVPAFEDTWIECLGDLGRYRMAIEDEDLRDRETWAGVARFWYTKAADKSPFVGRLYHHLAILARPNALQQLYYYARSLTCVQPFMSARESIMTLLDPILGRTHQTYSHALPVDENFIRAHGILFVRESFDKFEKTIFEYLDQLDTHIGNITAKWREQGVHVAVTNIASLFDYGAQTSVLRRMYEAQLKLNPRPNRPRAGDMQTNTPGPTAPSTPPPEPMSEDEEAPLPQELDLTSQPTFPYACRLTFSTFQLVMQRAGDNNILLHAHVILSFLYSLAALKFDCAAILDNVPWEDVATFLTALAKSEKLDAVLDQTRFPRQAEPDTKPLPEDYLIQGQIWSQLYFPPGWFNVAHDEEERFLELPSTVKSRTERILWIGLQIALSERWLRYNRGTKTWTAVRPSSQTRDFHISQHAFALSSGSSSEAMEIESSPIQSNKPDTTYVSSSTERMEGIIPAYARSKPDRHDKRHDRNVPHRKGTKNIILRNYTIFICEKTMLLKQSELFFKILDSGDWKVVVPERVLIEIRALSEKEPVLNETLNRIRVAIKEGRNLSIADAKGDHLSDPGDAFDRLAEHGAQVNETAEDVVIGVTRRQSDLNAQVNTGLVSYPDAKPAILVSEDKAMRIKARAAGVASIAASKIRKFVSSPSRKPEGSVG